MIHQRTVERYKRWIIGVQDVKDDELRYRLASILTGKLIADVMGASTFSEELRDGTIKRIGDIFKAYQVFASWSASSKRLKMMSKDVSRTRRRFKRLEEAGELTVTEEQ